MSRSVCICCWSCSDSESVPGPTNIDSLTEPCPLSIVHPRTGSNTPLFKQESAEVKTLTKQTLSSMMAPHRLRAQMHPMSIELQCLISLSMRRILSASAITQTRACSVAFALRCSPFSSLCDLGSWCCSPRACDTTEWHARVNLRGYVCKFGFHNCRKSQR